MVMREDDSSTHLGRHFVRLAGVARAPLLMRLFGRSSGGGLQVLEQ
jgi:hypothetical protein